MVTMYLSVKRLPYFHIHQMIPCTKVWCNLTPPSRNSFTAGPVWVIWPPESKGQKLIGMRVRYDSSSSQVSVHTHIQSHKVYDIQRVRKAREIRVEIIGPVRVMSISVSDHGFLGVLGSSIFPIPALMSLLFCLYRANSSYQLDVKRFL